MALALRIDKERIMIKLHRWYNPDCTIGRMTIGKFQCFTLELPDKDNQQDISCIPEGEYKYKFYKSPSKGDVLLLLDVENRTWVEVHAGNYTRQILGCILVGDGVKWLDSDAIPDVTNSGNTLGKILAIAGREGTIKITGGRQ